MSLRPIRNWHLNASLLAQTPYKAQPVAGRQLRHAHNRNTIGGEISNHRKAQKRRLFFFVKKRQSSLMVPMMTWSLLGRITMRLSPSKATKDPSALHRSPPVERE